jgi:hypothetical protein
MEELDGSCSKNANTSTEVRELSMVLEPVDCLRAMVSGADGSWFCLRLALDLAARRERDTDS